MFYQSTGGVIFYHFSSILIYQSEQ
uniref:Uncharacterized protein n=1 Tax=Anguilla anguilla TaxID=7936 RepID=A0A0E9QH14_ANGAN